MSVGIGLLELLNDNLTKLNRHPQLVLLNDNLTMLNQHLVNLMKGPPSDHPMFNARPESREVASQGQYLSLELAQRVLKSLKDMTFMQGFVRFHNSFVERFPELLSYYAMYGNTRVTVSQNKELSNWLQNIKTQLKMCREKQSGRLYEDPRYLKYLRVVGLE